jgi:hypothetical protein
VMPSGSVAAYVMVYELLNPVGTEVSSGRPKVDTRTDKVALPFCSKNRSTGMRCNQGCPGACILPKQSQARLASSRNMCDP